MRLASLLVVLAACGTKHEDFAADYAEATCLLYEECEVLGIVGGFDDKAACVSSVQAAVDPAEGKCPEYDKSFAVDCISGVNQIDCAELYEGKWPDACKSVCPDGSTAPPVSEDAGDTGEAAEG